MTGWLNSLQPWGSFLLRLVLGIAMVYYGYDKVVPAHGHGTFSALEHHAHFVASLGLPYWLGYISAFTEFFGGILLVLGLFTRFAAFLITINMLVALVMVNRHHGYAGSEYSLALFAMAVMLLFTGVGAMGLDRRIGLS
jgi:putative oxidoreductase